MEPVGIAAVAAVLVAGTAAGAWRRRTNGRLQDVRPARGAASSGQAVWPGQALSEAGTARGSAPGGAASGDAAPGDAAPGAAAAGVVAGGAASRVAAPVVVERGAADEDGSTLPIEGVAPVAVGEADPSREGQRLDPALLTELGVDGEARATLLQFSSAFCAPCRAVRRVSSEVAELVPGVSHVEVDAESHLDAVRALGIWRTPTLLLLDADGRVTKRATGVPTKPHLIAALGEML